MKSVSDAGLQLVFQFILNVFDEVEVRALSSTVHLRQHGETVSLWAWLCAPGNLCLRLNEKKRGLAQTVKKNPGQKVNKGMSTVQYQAVTLSYLISIRLCLLLPTG